MIVNEDGFQTFKQQTALARLQHLQNLKATESEWSYSINVTLRNYKTCPSFVQSGITKLLCHWATIWNWHFTLSGSSHKIGLSFHLNCWHISSTYMKLYSIVWPWNAVFHCHIGTIKKYQINANKPQRPLYYDHPCCNSNTYSDSVCQGQTGHMCFYMYMVYILLIVYFAALLCLHGQRKDVTFTLVLRR